MISEEIANAFDYFSKQLVNEIDNHAGLSDRDSIVLSEAIKNAVKQTRDHFDYLSQTN